MQNNKRFALSALAFAVALALVSCKSLQGHAVEIGIEDQTQIHEYLAAGGSQGAFLDWQWNEDEDGNRNTRLTLYGLQSLAFQAQSQFYNGLDFSTAPSTVTFSGSAYTGFYRYAGNLHGACLYPVSGSGVWLSSDLINITVSFSGVSGEIRPYSYHNGTYRFTEIGWQLPTASNFDSATVSDSSGILGSYIYSKSSRSMYAGDSGIPVLGSQPITYYISSGYNNHIIGSGSTITLPSGTVDVNRPWEYYNNVVLPYIREEFPGYEDYYFFPDGYDPPVQPSTVPVEYPTLPGFDLALETNGTEPSSEYAYNIPDMPTKDIAVPVFDFSSINPAEVMAPVADHLLSMWALVTGVLTEFGLFPYVAIAVFAAIIAGLLHLGK